ncbi:MAG: PIN domain-containing protein [Candidatus Hydrogenedentota bacterium]
MALKITRAMFVFACIIMGLIWAEYIVDIKEAELSNLQIPEFLSSSTIWIWRFLGAATGISAAAGVLFSLRYITQEVFERIFPAIIAIMLAMIMGFGLAKYLIDILPDEVIVENESLEIYLTSTLVLLFGFIGISLGLTRASNWESLISVIQQRNVLLNNGKIVDTSALIDGRIHELTKTGFVEGTFIVPRFVLHELQHIADSSDLLRRTKGRRGLDILKEMQEDDARVKVEIIDDNPEESTEVDAKLLILAKLYASKIVTTDYNLNKVAQIEGIEVLNINDLANALKPAALPDENMDVKIVKEGKEAGQGVGYLDDGTMIVVDGGRDFVGRSVAVTVTSVLQTAAGRMIFTKMDKVISDEARRVL